VSDKTATELDKSRRYLRPVRATIISDDPDGVHLAVYSWLPMFGEWATGPGICGESMRQGPLPQGTVVTCESCLAYQAKYERYLTPGYRPEDDDPEVLRQRADRLEERLRLLTDEKAADVAGPTTELLCEEIRLLKAEVAAARKFAGEMRDFCSPHGVAADYADRLVEAMDRAKEGR
jgi:hypothetical protein